MTRLFAMLAALALSATPALAADMRPVSVGRFAHFLDLSSVRRDGEAATFRYLMVTPEAFEAGGEPFWGGWSYMTIDCGARTADMTGFQSVRAGGAEGPRTEDRQPAWPIAAASLEAALAEAVCDGGRPLEKPDAGTVDEALRWGRAWLEE